jgi:vacuolar iron transporter family protein
MNHSFKVGFSFGLTSAIITTLGLIVGLNSGTHSKLVVIGGILTIAIADAFSDALGIHISEESENKHSQKEIWQSTFSTFLCKFIFAMLFVIPILIFELEMAIIVCIIFGMFLLSLFSYFIGRKEKIKTWKVITEHLSIAVIVIILTHFIGKWISTFFTV